MWTSLVLGVDFYHLINWFFIYSFLGWAFESTYVSIKSRKLVNRGYIAGPFCTIYGMGALSVYLLLKPLEGRWILIYFGGVLVATAIEYVTAVIMEQLFHMKWWDYTGKPFSYQGRICLSSSVAWGFFTVFVFLFLQPFVDWICSLYPVEIGKIGVSIIIGLYVVDFIAATSSALKLGEKLQSLDAIKQEMFEAVQTTKLYGSLEEIREKLGAFEVPEILVQLKKQLEEKKPSVYTEEWKKRMEEKMAGFTEKYLAVKNKKHFNHRRIINAYPDLKLKFKLRKDK